MSSVNVRSRAQTECQKRNAFLPRIINSDIQKKMADFRSDDESRYDLLENRGFGIDVATITINDIHWIDGASLAGRFICEFASIVVL